LSFIYHLTIASTFEIGKHRAVFHKRNSGSNYKPLTLQAPLTDTDLLYFPFFALILTRKMEHKIHNLLWHGEMQEKMIVVLFVALKVMVSFAYFNYRIGFKKHTSKIVWGHFYLLKITWL
jgi:hypothetical protein